MTLTNSNIYKESDFYINLAKFEFSVSSLHFRSSIYKNHRKVVDFVTFYRATHLHYIAMFICSSIIALQIKRMIKYGAKH